MRDRIPLGAMGATGLLLCATLAFSAGSAFGADEAVVLRIENHATEAMLTAIDAVHCIAGDEAFDGQTILLERPVLAGSIAPDRDVDCGDTPPTLIVSLSHLAGGELGRVIVAWDADGRAHGGASAERRAGACVESMRIDGEAEPVLRFDYRPCE